MTHSGFDEYGFSALPGGYRLWSGSFGDVGYYGYWWSATEYSGANAWRMRMRSDGGHVFRNNLNKRFGFSVRCVKPIDN